MRAANVVSRLLNGQSLTAATQNNRFTGNNQEPFSNSNSTSNNDGFADYEDVTDDKEN